MNNFIYEKLAVTNLKNNRKTYVPYIFTGVLTVMMFYIIDALSRGEGITQNTLKICLQYATGVIIVFAVIFLFYTNSFLIKRRKKEIGVYNILGMGKRHIARMMAVETILTAGISILGGLVFGIIFGKLMYLLLLKILHNSVDMQFSVNGTAIVQTVILFAGIFLLTYLYNILQIQLVNPVELLHGGNQGGERAEEQMASCDHRCGGTWQWLLDCTYNRGTVRSTFEILCCSGLCDYWNLCTFYCRKHCGIENTPEK